VETGGETGGRTGVRIWLSAETLGGALCLRIGFFFDATGSRATLSILRLLFSICPTILPGSLLRVRVELADDDAAVLVDRDRLLVSSSTRWTELGVDVVLL